MQYQEVSYSNPDLFRDRGSLVPYLAQMLFEGRICLVLGSGISQPLGLPCWEGLIENMYTELGSTFKAVPSTDLRKEAEKIYKKNCHKNKIEFNELVRTALYRNFEFDILEFRKNETLAAIASLVMGSKRGSAAKVISFNYDDLLESYLRYHGFVVTPIYEERHWSYDADVGIYHPHGFLPHADEQGGSADIILTRESYNSIPYNTNWHWRPHLQSILRTHFCIFIGLSTSDEHIDALLVDSEKNHPYAYTNTAYWGLATLKQSEPAEEDWDGRRVYPLIVSDFHDDLPRFLFSICQEASLNGMY